MENLEQVQEAPKKKVNPFAKYKIDDTIKRQGIWFDDGNIRARVTYAGEENGRYTKMLKLKLKPHETRIRNDEMPDAEYHKYLREVYAATVIQEVEVRDYNDPNDKDDAPVFVPGAYNEAGDIVSATEENIVEMFRLAGRAFQEVIKVATNFNLFRQGQKELDEGN